MFVYAQELSAQPIISGRSLVLAAETGSGKTLAYLAPLISSILSCKTEEKEAHSIASGRCPSPFCSPLPAQNQPLRDPPLLKCSVMHREAERASDGILILCPNAALCTQVRPQHVHFEPVLEPHADFCNREYVQANERRGR